MGNTLPSYCLRCFYDSNLGAESSELEIIAYAPPSESSSSPTSRLQLPASSTPSDMSNEEKVRLKDCAYNFAEIERKLQESWHLLLDFVKTETLPAIVSKDEVKVYGRETSRGFCLKSVWTVPQSIQDFLQFIRAFSLRPDWDSNVELSVLAAELPSGIVVNYQKFKKVMTVSARDWVVAHKTMQTGGSTVEVSVSIESALHPPTSDVVRVQQFTGGYYLELTESSHTRVTAVSEMDFGGVIPRALIMKMSAMSMPKFARNLSEALSRFSAGK